MRRFALFFLFIRVPCDYAAVVCAAFVAHSLRFSTFADWRPGVQLLPRPVYMAWVLVLAFLWIATFALAGLYRSRRTRAIEELVRVFMASSAAIMAIVVMIFLQRELFASRFIVLAAWILSFLFVALGRICIRLLELWLLSRGYGRRPVAVVGKGDAADAVVHALAFESGLAMKCVAQSPIFDAKTAKYFAQVRAREGLEEIIVLRQNLSEVETAALLQFVDTYQVGLRYSADAFSARRVSLEFSNIAGVPFVVIRHTPLEGWGKIYKRFFDIIISFVSLVLLSPLFLLLAIGVSVSSDGPIFYIRRRVGERGKTFSFIKFRTMHVGAPQSLSARKKFSQRPGTIPKLPDDPRWVPSFCRWMRRYSLDELPQFWHVLRGEMSLVGPRPHLPEEVAQYDASERRLLMVKPGLTGLAQISGRADIPFSEEARVDLWYIEHWSPLLDIAILARTPLVVLLRTGAY